MFGYKTEESQYAEVELTKDLLSVDICVDNSSRNKKHRDFTAHCYNVGVLDDKHTNTKHEGVFRSLLQLTMRRLVDWDIDHTAIINGKCENVDDN